MRGIFIGRFQPVHLGHLGVIRHILSEVDELIILVAAAQISHTFKNPLTGGERLLLIREALKEQDIPTDRLWIIPVQDISDNSLWVHHLKRLTPKFDVMYSNNPFTIRLFEEAGLETRRIPMIDRKDYSATEIRNRIVNNEDLESLVSPSTIRYFEKWDIKGRFTSIVTDDTLDPSQNIAGSELNADD